MSGQRVQETPLASLDADVQLVQYADMYMYTLHDALCSCITILWAKKGYQYLYSPTEPKLLFTYGGSF